jgi:hypothetical protein
MKKRLLYVCPHLSTGGQPQYVYKQILHFKDEFDIRVVEINNSGGDAFVVQKNKIRNEVPLYTLGEDRNYILTIIEAVSPDIIHFHEIPQFDLPHQTLDTIFSIDRNYHIVVTTHGSLTNPDEIIYHPDRYVLVSEWSRRKFEGLGIQTDVWQYPIEDYVFDKVEARKKLGFEDDWKHVLNVGLFAPGKNQKEIFDIARGLEEYKIKFHFVGNQAMNFEHYWKPLMEDKPDNCIVWGERNDVDTFYQAADLFYFSSILELNPLSIKEALSYKLPSLFRRLDTYLDTYDDNQLVNYITNDLDNTKHRLLKLLEFENISNTKPKIQIKHLLTRPDDEREKASIKSISILQRYGFDYQPIVNEVYEGAAPAENCRRPEHISKDNKPGELYPGAGLGWITGRHYGCYLAHRGALETMDDNYDYTLIFEADAYIHSTIEEFVDIVYKSCEVMVSDDVYFVSLADNPSRYKERIDEYFTKTGSNQDLAHAYIVRNTDKSWWIDRLVDCGWDVGDLWYNHVFANYPMLRYTTNKVYSNQGAGYSLLDETIKKWEL